MPTAPANDSFAPLALTYRIGNGPGGVPDLGPIDWQPRLEPAEGLWFELKRRQQRPNPLGNVDEFEPAEHLATATYTVARTAHLVATPARPGDTATFTATRCGPRPANTPMLLPGLTPTTLPAGLPAWPPLVAVGRHLQPNQRAVAPICAHKDLGRTTTYVLALATTLPLTLQRGPSLVLLGPEVGTHGLKLAAPGSGEPAVLNTLAAVAAGACVVLGTLGLFGVRRRARAEPQAQVSDDDFDPAD